jgi:hypothetical protein
MDCIVLGNREIQQRSNIKIRVSLMWNQCRRLPILVTKAPLAYAGKIRQFAMSIAISWQRKRGSMRKIACYVSVKVDGC